MRYDEQNKICLSDVQRRVLMGRLSMGYHWIAKSPDGRIIFFYSKPFLADYSFSICADSSEIVDEPEFYNFIDFMNSPVYLPDLLGVERAFISMGVNE